MSTDTLRAFAECAGIETSYRDAWGKRHEVSDATLDALLRTLRLPAATAAGLAQARSRLQASERVAAAPGSAWCPPALAGDRRGWGLSVQLYSLRNGKTWGIGDFGALAELVRAAARLGACAIGINPLHALFPTRPLHASPYSPSSRRFINPLYLSIDAMEDFAASGELRARVQSVSFQQALCRAEMATEVDYEAVASLKWPVLAGAYQYFRRSCLEGGNAARGEAFRRYQHEQGAALRDFAIFHVVLETRSDIDWRNWPEGFRQPGSAELAAFAREHAGRVEFHEYLQWQASLQLQGVHAAARQSGMGVGLYADLAVGADPTGAEAWGLQDYLAHGATVGAPPDPLNLFGQDWGLPPLDPFTLREAAFAPLASLWDANMRCAGALRIDHILGLVRLFWIPAGARPTEGAYVRYPWRELLDLLAQHSRRAECLVVGEDLGTVPDGLREAMRGLGMLCYRLLYFEQHEGRFRSPREFPAQALVAVGTHDLPSLPMWWAGEDIELRARLGLWPDEPARAAESGQREHARAALLEALRAAGLDADGTPRGEAPVDAIHAYLARTPCKLLMVQLEDVLGLHIQNNVPGTTDAHPNWRARFPCPVAEAMASPQMLRTARLLESEGRRDR